MLETYPAPNQRDVPPSAQLAVRFTENIDTSALSPSLVALLADGTPVAFTVTLGEVGSSLRVVPSAPLPFGSKCALLLGAPLRGVDGRTLGVNRGLFFEVADLPDTASPRAVEVTPPANASNVPVGTRITVAFSEALLPDTIGGVVLLGPGGAQVPVSAQLGADQQAVILTPQAPLAFGTTYTVQVQPSVLDHSGNPAVAANPGSFTTQAAPDTAPPTVFEVTPPDGSLLGVDATWRVTFDGPLARSTVTTTNVSLATSTGSQVTVLVGLDKDERTVLVTPAGYLSHATSYRLTVGTGLTDVAGNHLATAALINGQTIPLPDLSDPTVSATIPAFGATNVPRSRALQVVFSEPMNSATLTASSLQLRKGTTQVGVTVTVNADDRTVTIDPVQTLDPTATYTLSFDSTTIADQAGNLLVAPPPLIFLTAASPDTTPPRIDTIAILAGTVTSPNVQRLTRIVFNEPMDPRTMVVGNFALSIQGGAAVPFVVRPSGDGLAVILIPASALQTSTAYTISVTTGVTDLAGNALTSPFSTNFTTAPAPDTTPPTVSSSSPADGATGVPVARPSLLITFSEDVNESSANTSSVRLLQGSQVIPTTVTVDHSGSHATVRVRPNSDLRYDTAYRLEVSTAVRDLAGNALAATATVGFRTETPLLRPVTGQIQDSNGVPLAGVQVQLVGGGTGTTTTDNQGRYSLQLPADLVGRFELAFSKAGLVATTRAIDLLAGAALAVPDLALTELLNPNQLRFVLNWDSSDDYDIFLVEESSTKTTSYIVASRPYANLDHDDTDGFGPETLTVTTTALDVQTTYLCRVKCTGLRSFSQRWSSAAVRVYSPTKTDGPLEIVPLPTSADGALFGDDWNVLRLRHVGGQWTIEDVNTFDVNGPTLEDNFFDNT